MRKNNFKLKEFHIAPDDEEAPLALPKKYDLKVRCCICLPSDGSESASLAARDGTFDVCADFDFRGPLGFV